MFTLLLISSDAKAVPNLYSEEYGQGGSVVIKAMQEDLKKQGYNIAIDGYLGKNTVTAMQKSLNKKGHKLAVDGSLGPATVKAMQTELNKERK